MTLKRFFADLGFYSLENAAARKYEAERRYHQPGSVMFGPLPEFFEEKARLERARTERRKPEASGLAGSYNAATAFPKKPAPSFPRYDDKSLASTCDTSANNMAAAMSAMTITLCM
jgi:hypothetical protein